MAGALTERPHVWLVTDQAPAPVRNGITLPLFNYVMGMRETTDVSLCLLEADGAPDQGPFLAASSPLFFSVLRFKLKRQGRIPRLIGELRCREMFQHGWYTADEADDRRELARVLSDPCLVSPMSAVAKWRALRAEACAKHTGVAVAAVNDCTAAEYRYRYKSTGGGVLARVKSHLDGLRAPVIGQIEAKLLLEYDAILLQTKADRDAMAELTSVDIAAKAVLAPNGVSPQLLTAEPSPELRVLFVAELSGEHGVTASWLIHEVWPKVVAEVPGVHLQLVGRGASANLTAAITKAEGVEHHAFVDDLAAVYQRVQVVLSPVFKGFGLINKTLEGMAAGAAVVGPASAFNGIEGFLPGVHGLLVNSADSEEFARTIVSALLKPSLCKSIGKSARQLVGEQFNWGHCVNTLERVLLAHGVEAVHGNRRKRPVA